jgi:hypothetical protein
MLNSSSSQDHSEYGGWGGVWLFIQQVTYDNNLTKLKYRYLITAMKKASNGSQFYYMMSKADVADPDDFWLDPSFENVQIRIWIQILTKKIIDQLFLESFFLQKYVPKIVFMTQKFNNRDSFSIYGLNTHCKSWDGSFIKARIRIQIRIHCSPLV